MRNSTFKVVLAITIVAGASLGITRAGEPRPEIPARLVVERFEVARGGDCLLVPVRIAGKDRRFVVDTGSSFSVLDTTLCPDERLAVTRVRTAGEDIDLKLYAAPKAWIGSLLFGPLEVIGGYDLKPISQAAGYRIDGILGIDFLSQHVVHIEFDRGVLLLLNSVPTHAGEPFDIARDPASGLPFVVGEPARGETA